MITPRACAAIAGSLTSNSRRRLISAASHVDCDRKYCNRCTAACCAPATGSAPARPVNVLLRSRGASRPVRYSRTLSAGWRGQPDARCVAGGLRQRPPARAADRRHDPDRDDQLPGQRKSWCGSWRTIEPVRAGRVRDRVPRSGHRHGGGRWVQVRLRAAPDPRWLSWRERRARPWYGIRAGTPMWMEPWPVTSPWRTTSRPRGRSRRGGATGRTAAAL